MSLSVTCYVVPGKAKSQLLCEAFAAGCRGTVSAAQHLLPGPAFFYGVAEATQRVWDQVRAEGREYYYADNSYFDRARQRYFRITRNAFQVSALVRADPARLAALGVKARPWQKPGRHIVVVEQSDAFMQLVGVGPGWLTRTVEELRLHTDRPLRVRAWRRDKDKAAATLAADLAGAWALVTHMSAAANEALLAGIPVFVTGECAARAMASGPLSAIEQPLYPDGVPEWAAGLAANQWSIAEIRTGIAWRALHVA